MRKLVLLLVIFLATGRSLAQDTPTVEIVLRQPAAAQGDIITADVVIRGAINVGGADVGIKVDDACLRVVDRQPGNYLPTTDAEGAFVPLSELNEHDTRLATALTNRSKIASGEGIFYSVQLEVTCDSGTAPLTVSYAKLATYADPTAEAISLISFALDEGTLNAINAELSINPGSQAATQPAAETTATAELTTEATAQSESTSVMTTPAPAPEATTSEEEQNNTVTIIAIALAVTVGLFIIWLILWWRRRQPRKH